MELGAVRSEFRAHLLKAKLHFRAKIFEALIERVGQVALLRLVHLDLGQVGQHYFHEDRGKPV